MNTRTESISDELQHGTKLDNYIIQSVLGRGAFGITYLAIDNLDRKVAIKEYLPSGFSKRDKRYTVSPLTQDNQELFKYGLDCFLDEAKTVGKFNHPNIVRVLAFFEANQTAYIVMEYEVGQDLKAYLKHYPKLSEQRLLEIFCPINDGLIKVHEHGYIHRDIKPANIYIREDNSPVLIDFGAARDVFNARVDQLTRIMTPGYAPYEQDNPSWADQGAWTDIYALGATIYYAMQNVRIVAAQERASAMMLKTDDPYQSVVSQLKGRYTAHFLAAIDHALAFHPDKRPQNVSDWNSELLGSIRSDEDKTAILSAGKFSNNLEDTTLVASTVASTTQRIAPTKISAPIPPRVKPHHAETHHAIKRPSNTPQSTTAIVKQTSPPRLFHFTLASIIISAIVLIIYFYNGENNQNESTQISHTNNTNAENLKVVPPKENLDKIASQIPEAKVISVPVVNPPAREDTSHHELISSKVEIALAHIISASEFYLRANIKNKSIADFEKNNIKVSSKMLTTLKLQQSDFMGKFKYHFDIYLKNLLQLRNYDAKIVKEMIDKAMNSGEHNNKAIHVHLSDFFVANISENSINEITLEKNLKDTLQTTLL